MANVNEKRIRAVTLMKQRAKKNQYTQGTDRKYFFGKPDNDPANISQKGYSDCSSAVRAAIKEAASVDIGGNTSAQINNRNKIGKVVDETTGYYPDETKLLPGDCLYFKGNASHPLSVGHVEMYTGKNECYGHGSGKGPTKKNLRSYCKSRANSKKRYFMAVRWISDETTPEPELKLGDRVLQNGDKGEDVKELQSVLIKLCYNCGKWGADGDFGDSTELAVIAYQQDHGCAERGKVGSETVDSLRCALTAAEPDSPLNVGIYGGDCYVREAPNTSGAIIGVAKAGDEYQYQGVTSANGWHLVIYNNKNAWVSGKYSRLEH